MKKPDDHILKEWVAGELDEQLLPEVEAWLDSNPDEAEGLALLSQDEHIDAAFGVLEREVDPPYPDFFHAKIRQEIEASSVSFSSVREVKPSVWKKLQWLLAPATAVAMVACFYAGTLVNSSDNDAKKVVYNPTIQTEFYIPDGAVRAEVIDEEDSDTVIVILDGLEPIPDEIDISVVDDSALDGIAYLPAPRI